MADHEQEIEAEIEKLREKFGAEHERLWNWRDRWLRLSNRNNRSDALQGRRSKNAVFLASLQKRDERVQRRSSIANAQILALMNRFDKECVEVRAKYAAPVSQDWTAVGDAEDLPKIPGEYEVIVFNYKSKETHSQMCAFDGLLWDEKVLTRDDDIVAYRPKPPAGDNPIERLLTAVIDEICAIEVEDGQIITSDRNDRILGLLKQISDIAKGMQWQPKEEPNWQAHHPFCNYFASGKKPSECRQCISMYKKYGDRDVEEIMKTDFPDVIIRSTPKKDDKDHE